MNYFKFGISSRLMTFLLAITVLHQVLVLSFQSSLLKARFPSLSDVFHTMNHDQALPSEKHASGEGMLPHSLIVTSLRPFVTSTSAWY